MPVLTMNKTMRSTDLVQRLQKPLIFKALGLKDNPFSFGGGLKNGGLSDEGMTALRGIFSFDYMGASEFEWGAVPAALSFLGKQAVANNCVANITEVGAKEFVYYLCPKEYEEEVAKRLKSLRQHKIHTMEWVGLDTYFENKNESAQRNCGWLELDNGFMFFTDETMFNKTCELFGVAH